MNEFTPTTILENLLFSTVKINVKYSGGNGGIGTGFIFGYEIKPNILVHFFVTNKHIIKNAE